MANPFNIAPQTLTGDNLPEIIFSLNQALRNLRRDVTKLPLVIDVPSDVTATYGHASAAVLISSTIRGGLISPPARGIRLEAYGECKNDSGATATIEMSAVWGGVTGSVITASLDDVGTSSTVRHLTYQLDISQARTFIEVDTGGKTGFAFDGSTTYSTIRDTDLLNNTSTAAGIVSFWIRSNNPSQGSVCIYSNLVTGTSTLNSATQFNGLAIFLTGSGGINLSQTQVSGLFTFSLQTSGTVSVTDGDWHHVLVSWGSGGFSKTNIAIDDALQMSSTTSIQTATYNSNKHAFGGQLQGNFASATVSVTISTLFDGEISELWMDLRQHIDLSATVNRRLFIDTNGRPVVLGTVGQNPTGSAPIIYLPNGNPSNNLGYGGNFANTGTVVAAVDGPAPNPVESANTNQVVRAQLQISGPTTNVAGPAADTMIDLKTFFHQTSFPDIESDQVLQVMGQNSVANVNTGLDIYRARIDLI